MMDSVQFVREDDHVECFLFFNDSISKKEKEDIFSQVKNYLPTLTSEHIWHKDPLSVQLICENTAAVISAPIIKDFPDHIHGVCHFADNIEDEWLVVYLILQITLKFPQLVAKVVDSDGEFLLIESADFLPSWANPNNCDNRVFIKNGFIYLISPEENSNIQPISINYAIELMFSDCENYLAPKEMLNCIFQRIHEYPEKIKSNLYSANVFVPIGVAEILRMKPSLISAAVHAFCQKDVIDTKACRAMKYFAPEIRVMTRVTFTKCLYAMLMHSQYNPDRRTGWNLPLANSSEYKSHSLGVKLACGFEILASHASSDNIESTKGWKEYLKSLNNRDYFKGLIEKSKAHNELLEKAKEYYKEHIENINITSIVGRQVLNLLKSVSQDPSEYKNKEIHIQDDDVWLNLDASELENMLEKRYGKKNFQNINKETNCGEFTEKITEFLDHMSGIEGAEFPSNDNGEVSKTPIRPQRGIKKNKKGVTFNTTLETDNKPSQKIEFDADNFASAVQNILDLVIPDDDWNLDSGSEISGYGSENDDLEKDIVNLDKANKSCKEDDILKKYMNQMDIELSTSTMAKSFQKVKIEGDETIDVNVNALKNIAESYKREAGGSGPAGNILGPLGYTNYDLLNSIDDDVD